MTGPLLNPPRNGRVPAAGCPQRRHPFLPFVSLLAGGLAALAPARADHGGTIQGTPEASVIESEDGRHLVLEYVRSKEAVEHGCSFTYQFSANTTTWTAATPLPEVIESLGGEWERVRVVDPEPQPSDALRFARVLAVYWPTGGWATATPAEAGMDEAKLIEARDFALTGGGAGMVTRGGRQVISWGDPSQRTGVKSATKSIGVSALGLALADGLVQLTDSAQAHLASIGNPPSSNVDTGWLDDITLLQLATQTAGFDKPGGYTGLLFEPGTTWAYSDGGPNWLADVLTVTYGQDLNTLMFDRVFTPLGIPPTDLVWRSHQYRSDTIEGIKRRELGSGIQITPDAMARIGYLYLKTGEWDGTRILPESFVELARSAPPQLVGLPVGNDPESRFAGASNHYGLLWWNNADLAMPGVPADAYWAWGFGENLIVVIPSLNVVASRTGSSWPTEGTTSYYEVIEPFIEAVAQSVVEP